MKIVLRKCHTVRYTGACGIIKERESCWELVDRVAVVLRSYGHEVLVIEGRNDLSDHDQSKEGARLANEWGADVYISFHMNAFNGTARGTEYIVYDGSNTNAKAIAKNVCNFMASLGVPYRREIINNQFWELRYTNMCATIIELLFCDNAQDVAIWNNTPWDTLVYGICNAIDSNIPKVKPSKPVEKPSIGYWHNDSKGKIFYFHKGGYAKNQWLELDAWYRFDDKGYALVDKFYMDDKGRLFYLDNGGRALNPSDKMMLRTGNYNELYMEQIIRK